MADPFGVSGKAHAGDPFGVGGKGAGTPAKKQGGILHAVEHVVEQTGSDLVHAAINAPAGAYFLGKGLVTHPVGTVEAVAKSTAQDFEHPLRHPGNTLLDALALVDGGASIVGRVGAAGKAIEAGSTAADALKAGLKKPTYGSRTLRVNGLEVHPETARTAVGSTVQKASDKLLTRAAEKTPGGRADALLQRKVGKVVNAEAQTAERLAKAPAAALIKLGSKLKPGEQKALQVVAEQAPLDQRITATSARVTGARNDATRARHQSELDLLHQAKEHLTVADGKPALASDRLRRVYGKMEKVAKDRETLLKGLGMLSDEAVSSRTAKAARSAIGQPLEGAPEVDSAYRGNHTSPDAESGAPMHDLTGGGTIYPDDVYGPNGPRYYGHGDRTIDPPTFNLLNKVKGKPDAEVTVYRAVPGDVKTINPGDWVTPTKRYAEGHAASEGDGKWHVIAIKVPARELFTNGDSIHEFGWHPERQKLFTPDKNAVRIPDVATRAPKSGGSFGRVGAQGSIGKLKAPGSTTHEYGASLREQGLRREDTTRLVGESGLEAAKYAGLKHIHQLVRKATTSEPSRPDDIAVRLDDMKPSERMPLDVKKFLTDPEEFFGKATPSEAASMFEKVRQQHFINPRELKGEAAAEFQRLHAEGKIGFVPRRVLGDLAKPQAPLRAVAGSGPIKTVDAINNASRFAILYLKPAYAIPNVLGNLAVNMLQQGFAAPANLARAARANAVLGPELTARVDAAMGEGVARAVSAHGQGKLSGVVDKAAGGWGKIVDTPFRRASFFYEARRAGYSSTAELKSLLEDDARQHDLIDISQKANREAIDYENLTPSEKEIVRRVVFFYPWIRGSTVYAGRLLREHPVKTAVVAELGKQGRDENLKTIGNVPSYLEGVFKAGGGLVNPNSAAILQTPAQVAQAVAGLASGNISDAAQASGFGTPIVSLLTALASRKNSLGIPYKPGTNAAQVAADVLGGGLPQVSLEKNIRAALSGKGGSKLYPPSVRGALLKFLVGGIAPQKYNPEALAALYKGEQQRMKTGR